MLTGSDFAVEELGERGVLSPLRKGQEATDAGIQFVPEGTRIPLNAEIQPGREFRPDLSFERAGPRERLYFSPAGASAAIVTCGGLCPGLNNVIRAIVMQLYHGYGVHRVWGIRYGYRGLTEAMDSEPMALTPELVSDIHEQGGTILGTSRGPADPGEVVEFLRKRDVGILFTIGGDGTQRGALGLHQEARRQGYPLAVIGVPKTIDNDIPYVWSTFGFSTAIEKARQILDSAHNEARGVRNGIGLVKLMGREAGFIAAAATLASGEVNYTLVPEVPFDLEGTGGFLNCLHERLRERGHAVVAVAEGAGQQFCEAQARQVDRSGNVKLGDIGAVLCERIRGYSKATGFPMELKYFDPSYYIRSSPANTHDAIFCDQLARNAVHAAMAGKTGILIGLWYNMMTHVPISLASSTKKRVSERSDLWQAVLKATGQPPRFAAAKV
ncbi:MAG: ATP-dependent 6-phosphofructokinase [Bryobacteraceae bacterium]